MHSPSNSSISTRPFPRGSVDFDAEPSENSPLYPAAKVHVKPVARFHHTEADDIVNMKTELSLLLALAWPVISTYVFEFLPGIVGYDPPTNTHYQPTTPPPPPEPPRPTTSE